MPSTSSPSSYSSRDIGALTINHLRDSFRNRLYLDKVLQKFSQRACRKYCDRSVKSSVSSIDPASPQHDRCDDVIGLFNSHTKHILGSISFPFSFLLLERRSILELCTRKKKLITRQDNSLIAGDISEYFLIPALSLKFIQAPFHLQERVVSWHTN